MIAEIPAEKIREIRRLRMEMVPNRRKSRRPVHKYTYRDLGLMCGMSAIAAWFAVNRKTYRWVSE